MVCDTSAASVSTSVRTERCDNHAVSITDPPWFVIHPLPQYLRQLGQNVVIIMLFLLQIQHGL